MTRLTHAEAHLNRLRREVLAANAGRIADLRLDAHAWLSNVVDCMPRTRDLTSMELGTRMALAVFFTHLERESPPGLLERHRSQTLTALEGLAQLLKTPPRP